MIYNGIYCSSENYLPCWLSHMQRCCDNLSQILPGQRMLIGALYELKNFQRVEYSHTLNLLAFSSHPTPFLLLSGSVAFSLLTSSLVKPGQKKDPPPPLWFCSALSLSVFLYFPGLSLASAWGPHSACWKVTKSSRMTLWNHQGWFTDFSVKEAHKV